MADLPPSLQEAPDLPPSMQGGGQEDLPPSMAGKGSIFDRAGKMVDSALDPLVQSPVVKGTLQAVGERPELQPLPLAPDLSSEKPVSGPQDVIREGAKMAGETLAAPIRAGSTLQAPQMVAQQKAMDYLRSKGTNKYVALAAGMMAGAVADPLNVLAAGEVASGVNSFIKSRNALKMDIMREGVETASKTAETMGEEGKGVMPQTTGAGGRPEAQAGPSGGAGSSSPTSPRQLPTEPSPQSQLGTYAAKEEVLNAAFPGPERETYRSITGEPDYVKMRQAAGNIVGKYAQERGVQPTPQFAHDLWQELHDSLGEIMRAPADQKKAVYDTIRSKYPNMDYEFSTLRHQLYSDKQGPFYFDAKVKGQNLFPDPPPKGYAPTESVVSESTNHMELPLSTEFYPKGAPTKFKQWTDSAIKELDDLNSSKDLAAPSADPHQDFSSTVRRYIGHQELARFDAAKMTDEFAGYVPDKDRRVLLTLYSQLGRSPTIEELNVLRTTLSKVKNSGVKSIGESAQNLMDQSLSLAPNEKSALQVYNRYFDGMGENAKKIGVLDKLRDVYGGPHVYEPTSDAEMGFIKRTLTGKSKFGQARTFENVIEAAKSGYVPKTLDSAELVSIYHNGISRSASERYLMDTLEKQGLINYEGRGNQVKSFQAGGMKIQGEIYKKAAYSENPEVQKIMARLNEDPVLDYPVIHAIEKLNNFQKLGSLYLQVFHPKALAMEAMGKGFSPAKFQEGLKLVEQNPDYVRSMIRSGLQVNVVADVGKELGSRAAKEYKGVNPVAMTRKINSIYTDWVFSKYMTGLKVWNSNVLAKRFIEMGLTKERAMELAVEDSNRTFGGLNLGIMHRSPNMQRLFHMLSFAPDWTETRLRQMAAPFGRGIGDVTSREAKLVAGEAQRYWTKTFALAAVTHIAGVMNPYEKYLSVDMAAESGFKDVTKLAKLLELNPVYFSSKMAAAPRTLVDFMDPRLSTKRKVESLFEQVLPIPVQRGIREFEKESSQ